MFQGIPNYQQEIRKYLRQKLLAERDSDERRVIEILCALVKLYSAVEDWGQAAKYADELLEKSKNHRRIEPQIMYF